MRVLVTGAEGFVGSWLVPALRESGHEVVAAVRAGLEGGEGREWLRGVEVRLLELMDETSVHTVAAEPAEAVVHLAAVASGVDSQRDPVAAWRVNAVGTALLMEALGSLRSREQRDPLVLLASTAEVYGAGSPHPRVETDATLPCSPYAASKLAAEIASLEVHRRTGLRVVIARAFPHVGAGQDERFVVPAFTRRIIAAKRAGRERVRVGNLDPIREFLDVSDVAAAYVGLLDKGEPGEVYNVASGQATSLRDLFATLAELVGHKAVPDPDPELLRPADIPYLVGDSAKLRKRTGWEPHVSLRQALAEVVNAQTH